MNDTADKPDILAKYRPAGQQPAAKERAKGVPKTKRPYEPYRLSKDSKRHLELRLKFPDPAECPLNAMITNVRGEWRRGLAVTLIYGKTMMVEIKGKNLLELFESVKEHKIEWIEVFDDRFHLPVDDGDAPLVKSIEVITQNTELPPPMSQRH